MMELIPEDGRDHGGSLYSPSDYGQMDVVQKLLSNSQKTKTPPPSRGGTPSSLNYYLQPPESVSSAEDNQSKEPYRGLYFNDGERLIDFVLVYLEKVEDDETVIPEPKIEKQRKRFLMSLLKSGIEMERAIQQFSDTKIVNYIKLHIPFPVLCAYAEDMKFTVPIDEVPPEFCQNNTMAENTFEGLTMPLYRYFRCRNRHKLEMPTTLYKNYTADFKMQKISRFRGYEDPETFFTQTQRSAALWRVLQTTNYGSRAQGNIGIQHLITERVFKAAYPLHDSTNTIPEGVDDSELGKRQILHKYWANFRCIHKYQPASHVREYLGERVAMYFEWLGYYTGMLVPAAVVGVLVFLLGIVNMGSDVISKEVCRSGKLYKMCPPCRLGPHCTTWYLSDNCIYGKLGYLCDNPGTVFFATFMSIWSVLYLEGWKRRANKLAHDWDCYGYEVSDEIPRPSYTYLAPYQITNKVTGVIEPYFPEASRWRRMAASVAFCIFMVVLVGIFLIATILYRSLVSLPLAKMRELRSISSMVVALSGAGINVTLMIILEVVYNHVAKKLTEWEMHRTQTEFDDNFAVKVFAFQIVNYFAALFYTAFFKGVNVNPNDYDTIFGIPHEECVNNNCLLELAQLLIITMVGKSLSTNFIEILEPKVTRWLARRDMTNKTNEVQQRWEEDNNLAENPGVCDDFLEIVLQFGFATVFSAASPLAPLLALINNLFETRIDAHKMITQYRRPVVEKAANIGVWGSLIKITAHAAVITNACVIAFTSDFLPRTYYRYTYNSDLVNYLNFTLATTVTSDGETCRYQQLKDAKGNLTEIYWRILVIRLLFVIVFEHFVFGLMFIISYCVPDTSQEVADSIKREQYLAKQALIDRDTAKLLAHTLEDDEDFKTSTDPYDDVVGQV